VQGCKMSGLVLAKERELLGVGGGTHAHKKCSAEKGLRGRGCRDKRTRAFFPGDSPAHPGLIPWFSL